MKALYAYVGNDPLDEADPTGNWKCTPTPGGENCQSHELWDTLELIDHVLVSGETVLAVNSSGGDTDEPSKTASDSSGSAPQAEPTAASGSPPL